MYTHTYIQTHLLFFVWLWKIHNLFFVADFSQTPAAEGKRNVLKRYFLLAKFVDENGMKKHVFQQQLVGMTWRWMVQITEQQKNTLQDFELTKGIGNITQQQQY